jgi:hypothetical protein
MSSPGNPMSWIMSIEPLTRANYPQFEIDKTITDKCLVEPTPEVIPNDATPEVRAQKEKRKY